MESNHIGSIIMKKRKALGYTQQDLAGYLNVSYQAVSKWENGTAYPDINLLPGIAQALGVRRIADRRGMFYARMRYRGCSRG